MASLLALASSALWGTSDFLGGTLSRRAHPLAVMRLSQGIALAGLAVLAAATGELASAPGYLGWGLAAGVAGAVGLGSFYAALARGTMGVVAPVASTAVMIPVAAGLARGESPAPVQLAGVVAAGVGVVLVSRTIGDRPTVGSGRSTPVFLAAVAAVGFGTALVLVAEGSRTSVVMTLVTMRVVNVTACTVVLATVVGSAVAPRRADLATLALIGASDAAANGLYGLATGRGLVSLTAVLASLFPAVTAALAWRFHGERLTGSQVAGVAVTLAGVILIASGGTGA